MSQAPARKRTQTKSAPDLKVVRRRARGLVKRSAQTRFVSVGMLGTILVVGIIMAVLLEQVILAQSAFKLSRITKKIESAQAVQEELLLESARLESPARIERYAKQRLGMVDPIRVRYIVADIRLPNAVTVARKAAPERLPATGQAAAAAGETEDAP